MNRIVKKIIISIFALIALAVMVKATDFDYWMSFWERAYWEEYAGDKIHIDLHYSKPYIGPPYYSYRWWSDSLGTIDEGTGWQYHDERFERHTLSWPSGGGNYSGDTTYSTIAGINFTSNSIAISVGMSTIEDLSATTDHSVSWSDSPHHHFIPCMGHQTTATIMLPVDLMVTTTSRGTESTLTPHRGSN
jgi:hypothetical protein